MIVTELSWRCDVGRLPNSGRDPGHHADPPAASGRSRALARLGTAAAFVARPGMVLDPLTPRPEIVGADLNDVVDRILAAEASR